ncbi:CorA family divalent cation transporter [Hydrogenimonas sp.]
MSTEETKERLDSHLLEDIESETHPSDFEIGGEYTVLILRLPEIGEGRLGIVYYAFVVRDGRCYRYERSSGELKEMGRLEDLHRFLDERTDRLLREIRRYHLEIETLEEDLYEEGLSSRFMPRWHAYKKDVSLIHRLMFHATLAFELFIRHHRREHGFTELAYADLLEHMGRIRDLAKSAIEKLDNLYDFYRAKVDERMNRNMYLLTLISAIFLPLTLVTAFFGMNTGGLPYTDDPDGTLKAVLISLLLEALLLIPFFLLNRGKIRKFRPKSSD